MTLTVTDNRGGTHQVVRRLSTNDLPAVSPPPVATLAADSFERTVSNGLGTADTGGAWTVSGTAANYSVASGAGNIRMNTPGAGPSAYLNGVSSTSVSMLLDVSLDKPATGGGTYMTLVGRRVGTTGDYRANLRYQSNGTVQATFVRRTGTTDATLANLGGVPGIAPAPGERLSARFEVVGTNPTQLRLKVWPAGTAEPSAWLLTASDATASHQAPGALGVTPYLSGSATNAPSWRRSTTCWSPIRRRGSTQSRRLGSRRLPTTFPPPSTRASRLTTAPSRAGRGTSATAPRRRRDPALGMCTQLRARYAVSLTVVDDLGASNQVTLDVSVNSP